MIGAVQRRGKRALVYLQDFLLFSWETLRQSIRGRRYVSEILQQMDRLGAGSLPICGLTGLFTGMVFALQTGSSLQRFGVAHNVGKVVSLSIIKELGPVLTALVTAGRVGSGIAAQLSSMVVTEQVDALRMCAADPVDYLVKPRFIASLVMTSLLVVCASSVAVGTGMLTAQAYFDITPRTFLNFDRVGMSDVSVGFAKCLAYGAAIPVISSQAGLSTFGGSEGVGAATTRAVVNSSLAVVIMNFFISGTGYVIFGE